MTTEEPVASLIRRRRAQLLIHSYIYYVLSENIVSDDTWQRWANELVELQSGHKDDIQFYDAEFSDWTGDTGCHLPKDRWVVGKAYQVLRLSQSYNV